MSRDHIRNFERWSKRIPQATRDLVELVVNEVVPIFTEEGIVRWRDYAGVNSTVVGSDTIALQRRTGSVWPTVEIHFFDPTVPLCRVYFAELPELCHAWRPRGGRYEFVEIERAEANVVEGPGFFWLCRSLRYLDFGHGLFVLNHKRKLREEVECLQGLSRWLITVFAEGIPSAWYQHEGLAAKHAYLDTASQCLGISVPKASDLDPK